MAPSLRDLRLGLTGAMDGTVRIWSLATGALVSTLEGHSGRLGWNRGVAVFCLLCCFRRCFWFVGGGKQLDNALIGCFACAHLVCYSVLLQAVWSRFRWSATMRFSIRTPTHPPATWRSLPPPSTRLFVRPRALLLAKQKVHTEGCCARDP